MDPKSIDWLKMKFPSHFLIIIISNLMNFTPFGQEQSYATTIPQIISTNQTNNNSSMTDSEIETESVIVVGMNRTRLLKIMAMVNEEGPDGNNNQAVEYVPCISTMSSYEGEDGEDIRYMSSFVFHDGSPMNRFFDDEGFRENFKKVIMVGYEWKESDLDLIKKYFEAFLLPVEIKCVGPNSRFSSLGEEMQHFKNLTPEEKEEHFSNHTMGPRKMKQFILDSLRSPKSIDPSKLNTIGKADFVVENDGAVCHEDAENDAGEVETQEDMKEPLPQRTPKSIDQNLTSFACRMCRTVLLSENHLSEELIENQHSFKKGHHGSTNGVAQSQSLFCDESVLEWLVPAGNEYDVEGKLTCPNCSFKVGHWNWSGACFYGTWVVPAIQIPLSKIDVVLPLSERRKASLMAVVAPKIF